MSRSLRIAVKVACASMLLCAALATARGDDIHGIYFDEDVTTDQFVTTASSERRTTAASGWNSHEAGPMTKILKIVVSLALSGLFCGVPSACAQEQDIIGLYFDTAATVTTPQTTESPQAVTAYLILREPSAEYGVSGWECEIENVTGLDGLEPVIELGWELAAGYDFAEPPRFWVGIGTYSPLPAAMRTLSARARLAR